MTNEEKWTAIEERRFLAVYVDESLLADFLRFCIAPDGATIKTARHDLPEDIDVYRVFNHPERRGIGIILVHPSFAPQIPGAQIQAYGLWEPFVTITVAKQDGVLSVVD